MAAKRLGIKRLKVFRDFELVIKQVEGNPWSEEPLLGCLQGHSLGSHETLHIHRMQGDESE